MRWIFRTMLMLCCGLLFSYAALADAEQCPDALALIQAYPETGMTLEQKEDGLYIRIGQHELLFSPPSGCPETIPGRVPDAPLCTLFALAYPTGPQGRYPAPGFDPGRQRNEKLLRLLYGADAHHVAANCVAVSFLGETVLFNQRHGAANALARVAVRLEKLVADPAVKACVLPTAGTFAWRKIHASDCLSPHSFGIAIDLNKHKGLYWLWQPARKNVDRIRQEYPQAIVDAFEAEGFIWGGKWHAFDFMHFEYRPELLFYPVRLNAGEHRALPD